MTRIATPRMSVRIPLALCIAAFTVATPFALIGCDKEGSTSKSTTTKTTVTPEGVKKTTETTEKKVETEKKNP